jgi:hypothetical protein
MIRDNSRGFALVGALFMVLIVSVIGSSLIFVSRAETLSSLNYKTMSQGRYGAESAVHRAAHHLLYTYTAPTAINPADFDTTKSPVEYDGAEVVLSSDPNVESNYPSAAVADAFAAAVNGTLEVLDGEVQCSARARLISMRQITNAYSFSPTTLQTWEVTGVGTIGGAGSTAVEVSAIVDREVRPAYNYAAFAVYNGCDALTFNGGAETSSYDSTLLSSGQAPPEDTYGGDIGTNGNLSENGSITDINGTLSTPRRGLGHCTASSVTAATITQGAQIGALVELPQEVSFPTPDYPNPMPPTWDGDFTNGNGGGGGRGGGGGGLPATCPSNVVTALGTGSCTVTVVAGKTRYTVTPPANTTVKLGNLSLNNPDAELHLTAGNYDINSLHINGGSKLVVDSGPVQMKVAGKNNNGSNMNYAIDFEGSADILTPGYDPSMLQFIYPGDQAIRMRGGAEASMLVYAPNSDVELAGQADYYGAVVGKYVKVTGGAEIHYDRNLSRAPAKTAAEHTMSSFTWKSF